MRTVKIPKPPPEKRSESVVQAEIRKAVGSLPDVRLWRNNTLALPSVSVSRLLSLLASGKHSDAIKVLKRATLIKCGLAIGSGDLIGIVAPHGRFLSIECKSANGRIQDEQKNWIKIVRSFGGVAGIARDVDEAMCLVEEARRG